MYYKHQPKLNHNFITQRTGRFRLPTLHCLKAAVRALIHHIQPDPAGVIYTGQSDLFVPISIHANNIPVADLYLCTNDSWFELLNQDFNYFKAWCLFIDAKDPDG
jgi:hypothetical protein